MNVQPEWRQYLGATREAITILKALISDAGGASVLEERLAALAARIANLTSLAESQHERLVIWRGSNDDAGSTVRFNHGLGTEHVFWQIRDPASLLLMSFILKMHSSNESSVELQDDFFDPLPAGLDAVFIGVVSDRY